MIHKKNMLKRILYISLLVLLILTTQELYAQYILTRNFEANLSTAPFNVEITGTSKDVYDIAVDKLSATVKNNNSYAISGNVTFNNKQVTTFEISAGETKVLSNLTLTKAMVSGLTAGQYDLVVNVTAPYATTNNSIKVNLKGTITNVVKNGISETGLGTTANPYLVYKVEDLVRFGQKVSAGTTYSGKTVKQIGDIDFGSTASYYNSNDTSFGNLNGSSGDGNKILTEMTTGTGFIGIGTTTSISSYKAFEGTYAGDGTTPKAIRNLYINNNGNKKVVALFEATNGATIKNINISGNLQSLGDAATIVGWAYGKTKVTDVQSWVNVTLKSGATDLFSLGGIVSGLWSGSDVTLTRCKNYGNITGNSSTAGLASSVFSTAKLTVNNCCNSGTITSNATQEDGSTPANNGTAGLVVKTGGSGGTIVINRSYNSGKIVGKDQTAGLVSFIKGTLKIDSCYNIGNITGTKNVGGLLGYTSGTTTITNSYSAGTITATVTKGGIVGTINGGTPTYSTAYYLNTTASSVASNNTSTTNARTKTVMQSQAFATLLGTNFKYVSGNYPQLTWQ